MCRWYAGAGRTRSGDREGRPEVKKIIVAVGVLVLALVALRRFGPALVKRAMTKCQEMVDRMPEAFPPRRMMRGIEEIREQNSRILRDLEEERRALADASRG
jgi:hypothetical protein